MTLRKHRQGKNKALSIAMLACLLSLCACGVAAYEEDVRSSETGNPFPNYVYDDNAPQYYTRGGMAVSGDGYYYKKKNILHFYDVASGVDSPLCSRAECNHKKETCDAYVQDALYKKVEVTKELEGGGRMSTTEKVERPYEEINCAGGMVFYHGGHIYMIDPADEGDYLARYDRRFNNMERLSLIAGDGERVCGLDRENRGGTAFLYQDYLYYLSMDLSINYMDAGSYADLLCNRVKLEGGAAPERLGALSDIAVDIWFGGVKVCAIDGKVYFIAVTGGDHYLFDRTSGDVRVGIYDVAGGTFEMPAPLNGELDADVFGEGTGRVYPHSGCIDEKQNVYAKAYDGYDLGICRVSIDGSGEWIYTIKDYEVDRTIYADISAPIYDGEYIWFLESKKGDEIVRMRPDGSDVCRVAIPATDIEKINLSTDSYYFALYGVDKRYLLVGNDIDTYVIDRSAVGTENCVPKKISGD